VAQNSSVVLIGRYSRSSVPKEDLYIVNHFLLVTEFTKLILSCLLEFNATHGHLLRSFQENIISNPTDSLKIAVPALLYLVQNSLLYIALSNLSAPLFQVTYQSKLLTTAAVSVVILQRRYSFKQWICLACLGLGVAIVVLGAKSDDSNEDSSVEQSLFVGLISVSISCLCSALAGVYFELVIKKQTLDKNGNVKPPVSVWMRNMQLAFFSVLIALLQGIFSPKDEELQVTEGGVSYLHGFTIWVWILVALQAGGGLLVAAVIKYADNVLKGMATGVSVVTSTALSMVFFHTPLTPQFAVGALTILASVYIFSNKIPNVCAGASTPAESELTRNLVLPR